jgi:TPR repeat protein
VQQGYGLHLDENGGRRECCYNNNDETRNGTTATTTPTTTTPTTTTTTFNFIHIHLLMLHRAEQLFYRGEYQRSIRLLEELAEHVTDPPSHMTTCEAHALTLLAMVCRTGFGRRIDTDRARRLFDTIATASADCMACLQHARFQGRPANPKDVARLVQTLRRLPIDQSAVSASQARSRRSISCTSSQRVNVTAALSTRVGTSTNRSPPGPSPPRSFFSTTPPNASSPLSTTTTTTTPCSSSSTASLAASITSLLHELSFDNTAHPLALHVLAYSLQHAFGCAQDLTTAILLYAHASLAGVPFSWFNLGSLATEQLISPSTLSLINALADAAVADMEARYAPHASSNTTKVDKDRTVHKRVALTRTVAREMRRGDALGMGRALLRLAAEAGHAPAQFNVAVELASSAAPLADDLDTAQARHYYRRACQHGLVAAHYNLAFLLLIPRGGAKDVDGALSLLKYAAAAHDIDALYALGRLHEREEYGIAVDYNCAVKWYSQAMLQDHAPSASRFKWLFRSM